MNPDEVASEEYRSVLKRRYESPGWGASGYGHAVTVKNFAELIDAKTILDYGCGRGTLKPELPEFDVREYDPGIIGKDAMPSPADLLVATDVLEHIEPWLINNVLRHINDLARKGLFLTISLKLAREVLPDGRNAHLIVRDQRWWFGKLKEHGLTPSRAEIRKGLWVWIVKK